MSAVALYLLDERKKGRQLLSVVRDRVVIGKSSVANVKLNDIRCGEIHALIEFDKTTKQFQLIDLGSYYGTYKNKRRIHETELQPGEVFSIGSQVLKLDVCEPQAVGNFSPPPEEKIPTPVRPAIVTEKCLLQVTQLWGETVLDLRTFNVDSEVSIGGQREATFNVSLANPRLEKTLYVLSKYDHGELTLFIPREATGLVWIGSETFSLDTLRHRDQNSCDFDIQVKLRVGDRAYLQFGELAFRYEFVQPTEKLPFRFLPNFDRSSLRLMTSVAAFWLLVFAILSALDVKEKEKTLDDVPQHLKQVVYDAGIAEALKRQRAAIGQLAKNLEGGRARGEEGRASANKTPQPKSMKNKKQDPTAVETKNGRGQKTEVNLDAIFSNEPTDTPVDPTPALAGRETHGNTVSALSGGGFARGTKGFGAGGGGQSVGVGQLTGNSTGGGMGAGDFGLSPSKGHDVDIPDNGELVILGGLDPDVISAIIRRYLAQIQNCYEQQLVVNPKLKGKVLVSFIINKDGGVQAAKVIESSLGDRTVESCMTQKISSWHFPQPKGGGSVGVKYPFLLMSNMGQQ